MPDYDVQAGHVGTSQYDVQPGHTGTAAAPAATEAEPSIGGGIANGLRAGVRGVLDAVPYSHKFIAAVQGEPVQAVDQRYEQEKADNPLAFHGGQLAGLLGLPVKSRAGLAAFGALSAAGDSRGDAKETLKDAAIGGATGFALPTVLKGIGSGIGWIGSKILPKAQALEDRLASEVASRYAKPALDTAASAKGSLGAATAAGSNTLKTLAREEALPATEVAANQAALATPEAQGLATDIAGNARARLPDQLAHIQGARTLSQTTAQEAAQAVAEGKSPQVAFNRLKAMAAPMAKRYALPLAGAAVGALTGDDTEDRMLKAGTYALAGRGVSPTFNAVKRLVTSPEMQRLGAAGFRSMAERMTTLAQTKPQVMGAFAPVLLKAAQRGEDALAVTHYQLSQDPAYQQIQRMAAQEGDSK